MANPPVTRNETLSIKSKRRTRGGEGGRDVHPRKTRGVDEAVGNEDAIDALCEE